MSFLITPSTRLRPSPYYKSVVAEGAKSFMFYNKMMLPTGYGDPEAEYDRLINGVSLWDVAVQRQVQITGPDAAELVQALCPRDMSKCAIGQGKYVAMCDHRGTMLNDPIAMKLDDDRFWLSIADSDMHFWARGIGWERKMEIDVRDAGVSPLAVQGPKAEEVIAHMFGEDIRKMKYFWFSEQEIEGIPLMLARSGWSKQGGFELYLMDETKGDALYALVKEAGQPWGIGPGNPNAQERIESGLLSWGGDTDDYTNPFEVRMGAYVDIDVPDDTIGIDALRRIKAVGPKRHQLGVILEEDAPKTPINLWADIRSGGDFIGHLTNSIWSPRLKAMIGFGLVGVDAAPDQEVEVMLEGRYVKGRTTTLPFI